MSQTAADIGWWGQRWLALVVAHLPAAPTEAQLKSAARATARLRVEKGRVEAHVAAGSHGREETAVMRVKPWAEKDWKRLAQVLPQDVTYRLLTGQFGAELDEALAPQGIDLFPAQVTLRCTCKAPPDEGCRHLHALLLGGATLLDSNPYLWLEVLGRPRAELQAALQARVSEQQRPADEAELQADRFWELDADPNAIPVSPGDTAAPPDSLLRRLGPLPLPMESAWVEMHVTRTLGRGDDARPVLTRAARPVDDVLRDYVRYIGEATRALTTGEMPPRYVSEPLPGKPVPLAARVLPEVETALRQEGGLLGVEQLAARCPTTAALPGNLGKAAVTEALAQLPPDMTVLARRYAGPRAAVLEGRAFSHIISFDEWRRGHFSADADWHRALAAPGPAPQLPAGLWERLRPETGDELWLTVADPAGPYLQAELIPRRGRRPGLDPGNVAAARALLRHLAETNQWGLSEEEAVAVLLAEGHYSRREHQAEAWLLPFQIQGLSADRPQRTFSRETRPWQPTFGRPARTGWAEQESTLRWFNASAGAQQPEAAVRWWCQTWAGAQDRPGSLPSLGALLEFLWIKLPRDSYRHGVEPEQAPARLAAWFRALEARFPAVAGLYEPHLAVCERTELLEHRLRTLPAPGAPDLEILAWIVEGYRWIGAERCWEGGAR